MEFNIYTLLKSGNLDELKKLNIVELLNLENKSITSNIIKYVFYYYPEKIDIVLKNAKNLMERDYKIIRECYNPNFYKSISISENIFNIPNFSEFKSFLEDKKYTVVLDGANIVLSRHSNLENIIKILLLKGEFPLVIIHPRHYFYIIGNVPVFKTQIAVCDDYYILEAYYFKKNVKIISNDKYSDHIEKYKLNKINRIQFKNNQLL